MEQAAPPQATQPEPIALLVGFHSEQRIPDNYDVAQAKPHRIEDANPQQAWSWLLASSAQPQLFVRQGKERRPDLA